MMKIVEAAKKLGETLNKRVPKEKIQFLLGFWKALFHLWQSWSITWIHILNWIYAGFSYHGGTASSGIINIIKDIDQDITGRDILFVEDIIDTGKTLKSLKELFEERNAASVKIATLLDKPEGRLG